MSPGPALVPSERPAPTTMLSVITRLGVGGSDQRLHDVLAALDRTGHHIVVGADSSEDATRALAQHHRVTGTSWRHQLHRARQYRDVWLALTARRLRRRRA